MSTPFYDLASLVVVPSGYKSGKIYAQKPLTTDGQLTFTRASTATRVNASGLIETVASGVPRLDYLNSTCPKLLLEPQRTNVYTYSEQFDNAAWNKQSVTVSANAGTSPDGTANADKVIPSTSTAFQALYHGTTTATSFTYGVFAKAAGYNYIVLLDQFSSVFTNVVFNLSAGTCSAGGKIENYGNGWYRCSVSAANAGAATAIPTYAMSPDGTNVAFAGNGTSGVLLWGAQFESGAAYPTSYIKTEAAAVTRVAESITKTLVNSNTNFSFFLELDEAPVANGGGDWLTVAPNNVLGRAFMYANVFGFADAYGVAFFVANQTKFAWTQVNSSTAKIFSNGVLRGTSTSGTYSTPFNSFSIFGAYLDKPVRIKQFIFFDAPITDAQAIEITTP